MADSKVTLETGPIVVPRSLLREIVDRGYSQQHHSEITAILAAAPRAKSF